MKIKTISEFRIGDKDFIEKTISENDINGFAEITGDFNPVHVNDEYAQSTVFKGRIAHGILTAGLVSAALGMKLPGPGGIYVSQELKFVRPVRIGDTIRAEVEVIEIEERKGLLTFSTTCTNQDQKTVLEGKAVIKVPR